MMTEGLDSLPLRQLPAGPIAFVLAEDAAALPETLDRCARLGFAATILLRDPRLAQPPRPGLWQADHPVRTRRDAVAALNALHPRLAGRWLSFCFNAEFLFYPHCETRRVAELAAFTAEERRSVVPGIVLDLYADGAADAVDPGAAMYDATGYHAFQRWEGGVALDRQTDIHGGLGWRFEEHVPWAARRINRPALYLADKGLTIDTAFRFNDPERNTVNCPWHRNVTAAFASFRVAKALRRNPDPAAAIAAFGWEASVPFGWTARELLDRGFMEQGQWF